MHLISGKNSSICVLDFTQCGMVPGTQWTHCIKNSLNEEMQPFKKLNLHDSDYKLFYKLEWDLRKAVASLTWENYHNSVLVLAFSTTTIWYECNVKRL